MDDVMTKTTFGQAALKKFGTVPEGFEIYAAGWVGDKPEDWKTMRVSGAQFKGSRRIPHTIMTTVVTVEEMKAAEQSGQER